MKAYIQVITQAFVLHCFLFILLDFGCLLALIEHWFLSRMTGIQKYLWKVYSAFVQN